MLYTVRRSNRVSHIPKKYDSYILSFASKSSTVSSVSSHDFNVFSEPTLSHMDTPYLVSFNFVLNTAEPSSYNQAKDDPR